MTMRRVMVLCLCWGIASNTAHAQCEPEEPRSSKVQKLFDKALHPKGKTTLEDRLAYLASALDLEPEDAPMRMEAAELAFKASSRNPDMWGELTQHLDALEEVCPGGMPEALYLRGAMAYMNDDFELAFTQFQAYLSLPEDMTKRRRRSDAPQS